MANLVYGGKRPNVVKYNNADVHHVVYGGKTIWNKRITVTIKDDQKWTVPENGMKIITVQGVSFSKVGYGGIWYDTEGNDSTTLKKGERLYLFYWDKTTSALSVLNSAGIDNGSIAYGDGSFGDGCKFTTSVTVVLEY